MKSTSSTAARSFRSALTPSRVLCIALSATLLISWNPNQDPDRVLLQAHWGGEIRIGAFEDRLGLWVTDSAENERIGLFLEQGEEPCLILKDHKGNVLKAGESGSGVFGWTVLDQEGNARAALGNSRDGRFGLFLLSDAGAEVGSLTTREDGTGSDFVLNWPERDHDTDPMRPAFRMSAGPEGASAVALSYSGEESAGISLDTDSPTAHLGDSTWSLDQDER
jgi:hypothetical protein